MNDSPVTLEHEGALSILTVNRPRSLNALNGETLAAIASTVADVAARSETRALIVTGAGGKAFVAGADIAAMVEMTHVEGHAFAQLGDRAFGAIEALAVPAIAVVDGFALGGGCELALACDFIYASTKSKFGQPEVKLGVVPGFGGTQRLPRRIGLGMARELIYTGRLISADEALRIGLVNAVFSSDELMDRAKSTAGEIASNGPLAVAKAKALMLEGSSTSLNEAIEAEAAAFGALFATEDKKEGMTAFLAKRTAEFTSK